MTKIQDDPQAPSTVPLHTRAMLAPLFTWRGKDIFAVYGASQPTGEPDSEPDDDDDNEGEGEPAGDGTGGSDTVSREDFEKLRQQLSAADKNRSEAEKRLKAIEDAKKDELTKATEQVEELTKQVEANAKELAEARLQNAFLTADTGITWHDPGDALALAERKGYLEGVVGEDGKVDSVKLAVKLKELAKNSKHLVKDESSEPEGAKPPVRTGAPVGGKTKKTKDEGPDLSRYDRLINR